MTAELRVASPSAAQRILTTIALVLAILGGLGTVAIMAMINLDVIGRGAFSTPLPATAEIVSASIVSIVFLQLPYATASGRAVRSDMVIGRIMARSPRAALLMDAMNHLVGTIMLAVLLRYIWPEIESAIADRETVGLYGVFTLPRWPFVLAVLAGCVMTCVVYAMLTVNLFRAAFQTERHP
ncbi:TRAP transporter small permease [Hoeflea sp. WL0058]|uniref:TRAP transporter small permease protein n=1 Tax=Flavimaribacter sediminis TaxID=2865987 RepID=A0AAE2ZGF3_9HYPH|nr:TRAP transporter small permease [Flavimaribacter sediminis]MBW8636108.1 TRAP transporter small permease [Flavimaribacter sediminis]